MTQDRIETQRLELVAVTADLAQTETQDPALLSEPLACVVPPDWPPEFNDADSLAYTLGKLEEHPEDTGWWAWYCLLKSASSFDRTLIGLFGFKGRPDEAGVAEIGYSILPAYQKQGFATEAIAALIEWAHGRGATTITAETLPELTASQRVLEKSGFTFVGPGSEEGVILFRKPLQSQAEHPQIVPSQTPHE